MEDRETNFVGWVGANRPCPMKCLFQINSILVSHIEAGVKSCF
jgi:hypothetical protein